MKFPEKLATLMDMTYTPYLVEVIIEDLDDVPGLYGVEEGTQPSRKGLLLHQGVSNKTLGLYWIAVGRISGCRISGQITTRYNP